MSECHRCSDIFFCAWFGTKYDKPTAHFNVFKKNKNMEKLNIKPLGERVVIEPAPAEEKTASGIIIPDTAKEKPQRGTVVAVPDKTDDNNIVVKVGDTVLYGKYSGTEISIDGKDYLIMNQSDILAVI